MGIPSRADGRARSILVAAVAVLIAIAASCDRTATRGATAPSGQGGGGGGADAAAGPDADGAGSQGGAGGSGPPAGPAPDGGTSDIGLPDPPVAVDPAVSRAWTWTACGVLPPTAPDLAALFDTDGSIAVLDEDGRIRTYDASGTRPVAADGPASFLVNGPDGTVLAGSATPTEIGLRPIGATAARFTFALPAGTTCGPKRAFSASGEYFLAYGGAGICVWRAGATAADRMPVAALSESIDQVAVRGGQLVTVPRQEGSPIEVVTRDFTGDEVSRVRLNFMFSGSTQVLLSPAGDRIAVINGGTTLCDTGTGEALLDLSDRSPSALPQFTPNGDAVLFADTVFRTARGAHVLTLPPSSRAYDSRPIALSADGQRLLVKPMGGRTALIDLAQPGFTAVLGPHLRQTSKVAIGALAITADASTLTATYDGVVFGFRLAAPFEQSRTLWTVWAGDLALEGDISADGQWVTAAGDNRAVYGGTDGRLIWPQGSALGVTCLGSELRVSPKGKWAAGASYGGTMDVFSLADAPAGTAWKTAAQWGDTRCHDVASFSRDERTMATSAPAVYRTDANGAWQQVWSRFTGSRPLSATFFGLSEAHLTPDETAVLVSQCDEQPCITKLYDLATGEVVRDLPELTDPRPSLSPEGSWIIAGGKLLHLPSGDTRTLDSKMNIATALFTSRGEIIAGTREGALVRYCRAP